MFFDMFRREPGQLALPGKQDDIETVCAGESGLAESNHQSPGEESDPNTGLRKRKRDDPISDEQISSLTEELRLKEGTISKLHAQARGKMRRLEEVEEEKEQQGKRIQRMTMMVQNLNTEKGNQRKRFQEILNARLRRVEAAKANQEEQARDQQELMTAELQNLRAENADLEEQIRKAQEGAFRQMKAAKWMPRKDSSIRADLEKLEDKIRNWARSYSSPEILNVETLSPDDISHLEGNLQGICSLNKPFPASIDTWPVKKKACMLLLHAAVAKTVFQDIFNRPFYFFDDHSTTEQALVLSTRFSQSFGADLDCLYTSMGRINEQEAHIWRSQTLRLLRTETHGGGIKEYIEGRSVAICNALAESVLRGPIMKLCGKVNAEEQDKRDAELVEVLVGAGKLAGELWAQRTWVMSTDSHNLGQFNVDSPTMIAHRLQKLDDDDHQLDAHEILAVIQPALVAFGDENGENYEHHKIWSKAIVLVAEE